MDISSLKLAYNKRNFHARKLNSSCLLFARSCSIEKMCTYIIQGDFLTGPLKMSPDCALGLSPWTGPPIFSSIEIIFTSSDTWTFFDHGGGGGANYDSNVYFCTFGGPKINLNLYLCTFVGPKIKVSCKLPCPSEH